MKKKPKILTISTITLILFAILAPISINSSASAQPNATLTGTIYDYGNDTDGDGLFNFLLVEVEVDVNEGGLYRVEVESLRDEFKTEYFKSSNETYLDPGVQNVILAFNGIAIYGSELNVTHIVDVSLSYWEGNIHYYHMTHEIALSATYNYTLFDTGATLTGVVLDEGVDTDGDGLYNLLQVGVEINVTDAATYQVNVDGLYDGVYIPVYNHSQAYLSPGNQTLNVTLNGAKIYASRGHVSRINSIYLYVLEDYRQYEIDYKYDCPLSKTYNYSEFDPLVFFTGTILDDGVDEDSDGSFDYLRISVEVNVTDAGYYGIRFESLVDSYSDYIDEYQSIYSDFNVGLHLIDFTVYGPKIYHAGVNPEYIETLSLHVSFPKEWITLEEKHMVPLPVLYNYTEFESHAFLTGKVHDCGVDTDADGLFDYLEVGIEVNVTETGTYQISVSGLMPIYYWQSSTVDLDVRVHVINFTFPGPMIAYYHVDPMNVTELRLTEIHPYCQLDYIPTVALSERYNYTQFNSPFNDMQIEFTVYPNATLGISGSVNQTRVYPPRSYDPLVNASLGFWTSGDLTTGSVSGTMELPRNPPSFYEFPFNSTTVDLTSEYYNGMLNAKLDATMLMPPAGSTTYPFNSSDFTFNSTYSDGTLSVDLNGKTALPSYFASQFPFNVTDATVLADYANDEINGNITFHMLSGFPLGDVIVYFTGNRSEISFTGYVNVIYGDYFGMEINATVLEEMLTHINSTIPGRGEHSLYNMTEGMIECTKLNTTTTPITGPPEGARVDYNATISGNFTKLLAELLIDMLFGPYVSEETHSIVYAALDSTLSAVQDGHLELTYWYISGTAELDLSLTCDVKALWAQALQSIPPVVPSEYSTQFETWLKIANITAYAVESLDISVGYSDAGQRLDVNASLAANVTQLEDEIKPILADTVPPEYSEFIESCTNTTYCTLDSFNTTCNYANCVTSFNAEWLLEGDFKAELNRIKRCYIDYINLTSPWMIDPQMRLFNATEIDIDNLEVDMRLGENWMTLTFDGLRVHPARDEVDFIRFKLHSLFNITISPYESPREFEKLKITIIGGSNATHTILLYAPGIMPTPNMTSLDYKTMTWENVTMSSMKDLLFKIAYQGVIPYLGKTYYVPIFTNSTVSEFFGLDPYEKRISFNVTGTTGTGFCNITIPKSLLNATLLEDWVVKIDGVELTLGEYSATENAQYVFIHLNYSHSNHLIEIKGTWIITEFQPNILPLILAIVTLIAAVIAIKQRKKLHTLKAKSQSVIRTFVNRLHK